MKRHEVKQGESIASIAEAKGFGSWRALYEHADNAALRAKRPDPFTLQPGDVVNIPEGREWLKRRCASGKVHVFGHKAVAPLSVLLHLRFDREDPTRFARKRYELTVAGKVLEGFTGSDAQLHHAVPLDAKQAELALWLDGDDEDPERWRVDLSHLNPIESISGIKGRMINLGYLDDQGGELDEAVDDATKQALTLYEGDRAKRKPEPGSEPQTSSGGKPDPRAALEARARPDYRPGPEYLAAGKSHRLRLVPKLRRIYLRLTVGGVSTYAERPYTLEVDGEMYEGTTSEDAEVELEVPASAREAELRVSIEGLDEPETWTLELGDPETEDAHAWADDEDDDEEEDIDEASEDARFIASLVNIGFLDRGQSEDGAAVSQATAVFQAVYGLAPSGEIDSPTLARMRRLAQG